jgi:hypothetical protein
MIIRHSPLSTFVIDNPRRGVLRTRKQIEELKYFIKLCTSRSLLELVVAAALRSISDDLHDDDDELLESRRSLLMQMQLLNMFV